MINPLPHLPHFSESCTEKQDQDQKISKLEQNTKPERLDVDYTRLAFPYTFH